MSFARLLVQMIKLRAQFLDYPIKAIRLDNACEFTSRTFNDYCISVGVNVEHLFSHVHTQNSLVEFIIKRLQFIAIPLLMKTKLPSFAWAMLLCMLQAQ